MVRLLTEANPAANVNGHQDDENITGLTPLHGAAATGSVEIAEYLLTKGAIIDIPNKSEGTALYMAAEEDETEVVKFLLDRGADPNTVGGISFYKLVIFFD